jgi:hypothetical protein
VLFVGGAVASLRCFCVVFVRRFCTHAIAHRTVAEEKEEDEDQVEQKLLSVRENSGNK